MTSRYPPDPHIRPGIATAEEGIVLLDGPNGVAISLTAEAAAETGRSLVDAAAEALKQRAAGKTGTPTDGDEISDAG
ncbi:hypothetical protein GGC65_001358 [Sphingopyxis sp. OAS728]|uniref:hypothetical protein n=1 Tax=Sphingopyxis sp. OAS728 TaxID=2663823 RepID=UPI001789643F|nr:hypothetical protein [Sphingopyxis sp. OAS728]MBE1526902.1 hypothetical protein [Sphingopyxis sp. OAS728]